MNIFGMMRIKNEERWIERVITAQLKVASRIFILDDSSTDRTRDICGSFDGYVDLIPSPFRTLDETRDKNFLLEYMEGKVGAGDYVLAIDGDEEIAPGGEHTIRMIAGERSGPDAFRFRVLYLWDRPDQIRVDGVYANFRRASLFRYRTGTQFVSQSGGGFHCGNVPEPREIEDTSVLLLHYGYMHREDRLRKWEFYNANDPKNVSEGYDFRYPERRSYPHMVQGDVPEVPANITTAHAGPLRLEPLGVWA